MIGDKLECVPDRQDGVDPRDAAHIRYVQELQAMNLIKCEVGFLSPLRIHFAQIDACCPVLKGRPDEQRPVEGKPSLSIEQHISIG
jgi:hypothetical protein